MVRVKMGWKEGKGREERFRYDRLTDCNFICKNHEKIIKEKNSKTKSTKKGKTVRVMRENYDKN